MSGKHIKDLIKNHRYNNEAGFRAAGEAIIEEERGKNHNALADEIQRLLGRPAADGKLLTMPVSQESRIPLATLRETTRGLDTLSLTDTVEQKLARIIQETAAWPELDAAGVPRRNRVLLSGPPGCGKTTASAAVAAALGLPLLVARTESLIDSHLGATGGNISSLFDYVQAQPSVLLLDEFDSIGQSRTQEHDVGEMRRVTNTVLQLIENFTGDSLIIAATNHTDALDQAMWRRFDHVIEIGLPSAETIESIIRRVLGDRNLGSTAGSLAGLPHAAAEYLGYAAKRRAVLAGRDVTDEDIVMALDETLGRRWA